jgi:2-oxoglutarate ferredoxin oxidoreductase subunit alpha
MREQVSIPPLDKVEIFDRKKPQSDDKLFFGGEEIPPMPSVGEGYNITVTGSTHNELGLRFTSDPKIHKDLVERLVGKIQKNSELLVDFDAFEVDDCDVGLVTFGCTSRAVDEATDLAREDGIKVGHVRLKTIWPFPEGIVQRMAAFL